MNTSSKLHQILLQPTDVLFFRDGRPMEGASPGYTSAWPLPDVVNHAFHAALHRAGFTNVHRHRRGRSGRYCDDSNSRTQVFGCLLTAGPFPVRVEESNKENPSKSQWYFPRPLDTQALETVAVTHQPMADEWRRYSSLPSPLEYAVVHTRVPQGKDTKPEPWISCRAYENYLTNDSGALEKLDLLSDGALADLESRVGIGIDPLTGTTGRGTAEGKIYSAFYLRVRDDFRLGVFAEAEDKQGGDLIRALLNDTPQTILVGGQQRTCTAQRRDAPQPLPLPRGLSQPGQFSRLSNGTYAVKWILLTPAIWPRIQENPNGIRAHPGGWLPNWVCPEDGKVLLKAGDTSRQEGEPRLDWRERVRKLPNISARLVAALIPKPIVVTGWALPDADSPEGGAKSTHLAVPAGAVYYFEADSETDAQNLAAVLNWHGTTNGSRIENRRSTLLGEKGYGLGVCGTWKFYRAEESEVNPQRKENAQ